MSHICGNRMTSILLWHTHIDMLNVNEIVIIRQDKYISITEHWSTGNKFILVLI